MSNPIRLATAAISGRIFAGRPTKDGMSFKEPRYDVTSDALKAVMDHIGVGMQADIVSEGEIVCTIKIVGPSGNASTNAVGISDPSSEMKPIPPTTQERIAEQIAWSAEAPPKTGAIFYGHTWSPYRWKAYSPKSEQFRRGLKGRWQAMNEHGGWDNAKAPNEWATVAQIDARRALIDHREER